MAVVEQIMPQSVGRRLFAEHTERLRRGGARQDITATQGRNQIFNRQCARPRAPERPLRRTAPRKRHP
jgi:hypothetical protein